LKASGANAEFFNLRDKGITGNSHFAMLETNRKEIFDVLKGWIESKVAKLTSTQGAAALTRRCTCIHLPAIEDRRARLRVDAIRDEVAVPLELEALSRQCLARGRVRAGPG
jgi:hypothetical protein